jgi:hypothetical protein
MRRAVVYLSDRILSAAGLSVLTVLFGVYGIGMLVAAYRTADPTAWTERAVQGGLGMIASTLFTNVVASLFC